MRTAGDWTAQSRNPSSSHPKSPFRKGRCDRPNSVRPEQLVRQSRLRPKLKSRKTSNPILSTTAETGKRATAWLNHGWSLEVTRAEHGELVSEWPWTLAACPCCPVRRQEGLLLDQREARLVWISDGRPYLAERPHHWGTSRLLPFQMTIKALLTAVLLLSAAPAYSLDYR